MNQIKRLFVFISILGTANLFAAELAGYPHDALANLAKYNCKEGEQLKFPQGNKETVFIYELCIDKKFSPMASNILRQSFHRFARTMTKKKTIECFNKRAGTTHTETTITHGLMKRVLGYRKIDTLLTNSYVFISALDPNKGAQKFVAEGYLNYFDNPKYSTAIQAWMPHLSIAARIDLVGNQTISYGNDIHFWSSQLAMAVFKNLGYEQAVHSLHNDFNFAVGNCVLWDGSVPTEFEILK